MKRDPLVYVEWHDSANHSPSWGEIETIRRPSKPVVALSVGWLVSRTKQSLKVLPHVTVQDGKFDEGCGEMIIPASAVVRIVKLRDPSHAK